MNLSVNSPLLGYICHVCIALSIISKYSNCIVNTRINLVDIIIVELAFKLNLEY